ncbi:5'-nucleotidase C-terminal domain-containing protein [uncultured Oscillibacter sp.]|uniref:5'-nucleotidase C-terminal domain-containing protein n=1 Tax=uncultured Oscillibacter sp. TaxID=876091 RepID=UPI0025F0F4B9|nr:5'-nucleotidase C-terminal domain-containing protein [uncultured Oscillibacter sp.]
MKKKVLSLFLVVAMMLSLGVTAAAAETSADDLSGAVVILHTNDVHGAIDGYAKVAALKKTYEDMGAYVLLLDAGDFSQGDPTVSAGEGAAAVELMNLAGYDAAAPGNHEFDYGYANLSKLADQANFPIVAANVLYQGKTAFEDNVTFTAPDGTKIGVFGLDTPETATKAHPAKIQGVTFLSGDALAECAQEQVEQLKAAGCDVIVCLGHLGIDEESKGNRSIDLLEKVDGIDLFIDGHSHSTQEDIFLALGGQVTEVGGVTIATGTYKVNGAVLTSTGTKFESIGLVVIADGRLEATTIPTADITVTPDKTVADRAAAIQKAIDDDYGTVFAKTEVALDGEKANVRTAETNLGDLIADALVWGAEETGEQVDAAVTNGGGIRASIAAGSITKKDINTVLPFGNTLSIVKVTGAELLEALEASTYCTPESIGGFPQVSGITFTVDTDKTYDQGELYPGSTYYAPKSINRVSIQTVGGKAFDPKATYTIATNDFLAAGGDTYYAFSAATVNYDLGLAMDEVVMNYITDELGGTVTAKDYGTAQGRITIQRGLPFIDVSASEPYYDAVKYCYDNNIFKGITEQTFAPNATMNRGQMVTVLWRMNGSPEPTIANPFTDVAADSAFAKAITWAAENGLTTGKTETTFAPKEAISRQQFLTILYRYAQFKGYDVNVKSTGLYDAFTDKDTVSDYAKDAMTWAVDSGVLVTDKVLFPTSSAMRFQVAEYLSNFCQKVVPAETAAAA